MILEEALDRLLELAGSDLLISAGTPPQIRKDGSLMPITESAAKLTAPDTEAMLRGILDEGRWRDLQARRNVDFSFTWQDRVRIRGNAFFQRGSLAAAFRMLPLTIPTFEELGAPDALYDLIARHQGLVLVTGPTGSGKSTTQAAMIDYINRTRHCHIITIEDPIEYVHRHQSAVVDQREIGSDAPSLPKRCDRSSARTRTWFSSGRCATWRRSHRH